MTFKTFAAATAATAALAVAPLAPAFAQQADDGAGQTAPDAAVEVSDELVTNFVLAALDVNEVATTYRPRIEGAADEATRESIIEEARLAMVGAVEDADGITVDEYIAITQAAQADEALDQRVQQRFAQLAETAQQ